MQKALLLETVEEKRTQLINYAFKLSKNHQTSEDIMQHLIVRILQADWKFEIETPYRFLHKMVNQIYFNHYRVNKKYVFIPERDDEIGTEVGFFEALSQFATPCTFTDDLEYSITLKQIKKAAGKLTKKQREAILSALSGEDIGENLGSNPTKDPKYETNKTHRRLGMLKLREILLNENSM